MRKLGLLAGGLIALFMVHANAQVPTIANVVSACGTANSTYTARTNKPVTQDVNGTLCTGAASGATQQTVAPGTAATKSDLVGCVYNTSAPAPTNGQGLAEQCDSTGNLKVTAGVTQGSTTSGQTEALIAGAVTTAAPTYTTAQSSPISLTTAGATRSDVNSLAGTTVSTDNGASGAGVLRVTIANNSTGIIGQVPVTTGGLSVCFLQAANTTNSTNCKGSAGQVYQISLSNNSANLAYLKLYNKATAPTCNTDAVVDEYVFPPTAAGGVSNIMIDQGLAFATGIGFCVTGVIGPTDTTAVAATAYLISIKYK